MHLRSGNRTGQGRPAARPLIPYGVTKLAAESLAQVYYRNFRLPLVILRYFTVYGPRQRPDMAFHRFILAILKGHPVTVFGSSEQTRDFTYVSDIIEATLLAMTKDVTGHVFNIGGDFRCSVNHVLKLIQQLTGQKIIRQALPPQPGEPRTTRADISSAQKVLGYKPKVTLIQGLKEEIKDLRKLYDLPG
ncbi:MAG: NAD-dependent epimerase/dehydratase family protein [Clostridia bacterium]|nr:NAD-dependent epimerase/dehydratase family protein [Clostridia bacterium]